jgi:aspartate carbamoyltransferase catalytic subunit
MLKMGGNIIEISDNSSAKKGESLEDTIKTVSNYGDIIVLRHPEKGSAERAAKVAHIPIMQKMVNILQALLDIYTIYEEAKKDILKEKIIIFIGDLKNSRTIHLLNLFDVTYISPGLDTNGLKVLNLTLDALLIIGVGYISNSKRENR